MPGLERPKSRRSASTSRVRVRESPSRTIPSFGGSRWRHWRGHAVTVRRPTAWISSAPGRAAASSRRREAAGACAVSGGVCGGTCQVAMPRAAQSGGGQRRWRQRESWRRLQAAQELRRGPRCHEMSLSRYRLLLTAHYSLFALQQQLPPPAVEGGKWEGRGVGRDAKAVIRQCMAIRSLSHASFDP